MSTSSELSRILNTANVTMYSTEPQPNLQPLHISMVNRAPQLLDISFYGTTAGPWNHVNPQYWTKKQVLEWIEYHVEESKFDASLLNMAYCSMDGSTLCHMNREDFTMAFGTLGERLHQNLEMLKAKHGHHQDDLTDPRDLTETYDLLNDFLLGLPQSPLLHDGQFGGLLDTVVVQPSPPQERRDSDSYNFLTAYKTEIDNGYESLPESLQSSTGSFLNPSSPESNGSDSDPEFLDMRYPVKTKSFEKQERGEQKKRGRGRPPKLSRGSDQFTDSKKSKHTPRGTHLWEFIRDILIHPEQNQGLMKWEDRRDGVFKFLKSEAVAQLWGQKKKNSSMTYEKLSRAMRYYYKRDILERVDGRRLVYKFGKNSSGWKLEELGM
ncbi:ETS-related transcription factor Elf-3 isoform X2 [Chanos chanos]|uniref:ETS-related transcription factor Elf-3 isoform X2 n=1 Tax=Chanos chanos TaxID=29144 RepID=A0A6J2VPS8_CHACN|nr:ETS-related transcription factor Elf-3 isoform X2 [Chanos chanos]